MTGICIICGNEHQDGKVYTRDHYLKTHYKKELPVEVSEWELEELL